jgi:hypothetical protein
MLAVVLQAILWLAPFLGPATSASYARLIVREASARDIDPLVVVALAHRESRWNAKLVSKKNYGLLQVRVSETTNPHLRGREHVLLDPERNIREGLKLLKMWKRYHDKPGPHCRPGRHFWTAHYQWGGWVGNRDSGDRVYRLYQQIVRRFRGRLVSRIGV